MAKETTKSPEEEIKKEVVTEEETVTVSKESLEALMADVAHLKEQNKMLYEVADKGRVFNYEAGKQDKKPFRVKLSEYGGGIIVGWRTVKDELVKHPTTGRTVGEVQEYELLVLTPDGETLKLAINGYPAFSDARYGERIEAEVVSRREDFDGKTTLTVSLPNGKTIDLDSRFVN